MLSVYSEGERAIFSVTDADGIPQEQLENIFKPFLKQITHSPVSMAALD
ncbi:MAG: hypothetical protein R3E08_14215 [Thiotrichaceae bacterium]